MRKVLGLLAMGLTIGGIGVMVTSSLKADEKPDKVLRHIVMYQFKENISSSEIQEVIDAFAALPQKIKTIIDFEKGRTSARRESRRASRTSSSSRLEMRRIETNISLIRLIRTTSTW